MTNPDEIPFDQRAEAVDQAHAETLDGRVARLRAALVDSAGLDDIPEPDPLIPGVLYRDSLAWLYGLPGCGKSFIAIDVAGCVSTGEVWQGYGPATEGPVLYLIAEGVTGVKQRVRAWEGAQGVTMRVQFLPVAVQTTNGAEWAAFVQLAAEMRPALIVVDTQARVTVGAEENSAKEMGEVVHRLERLRQATGACVLVVHHSGRAGEHMRGSIAMDGAATTILKVEKTEDLLYVECGKQKDAAPFDTFRLRLVSYETSAVLSLMEGPQTVDIGHTAIRSGLRSWWDSHETDWVSASTLIDAKAFTKPTFYRAAKALEKVGLVESKAAGNGKRYRLRQEPQA